MLMPRKRFRFDNKYLYGSAAFVVGFGGIMTLFVNFAPVHVPNANIATTSKASKNKEAASEATDTATNDSQGRSTNTPAPRSGTPRTLNPTPRASGNLTLPTTPAAPASPVTPPATGNPETPAPTQPVITLPNLPGVPLDLVPGAGETPTEPGSTLPDPTTAN